MPPLLRRQCHALAAGTALLVTAPAHAVTLESPIPIIDHPFVNQAPYAMPSMAQSLALTKTFYQYGHQAIGEDFADSPRAGYLTLIGFDLIATWLPLGNSWLHEEWHRAVMGRYGIDSHNEIYDFNFEEVIKVYDVDDAELVHLKDQHPADHIRLSSAGLEAQYELNHALEQDTFFARAGGWHILLLWMNTLNNIAYLDTCASRDADELTREETASEGADISARDFTGLDCNAWVYDLHRPAEPYADRGTHPSGVGIDRYRDYSDLTRAEQDYLKHMRDLSLLNLVDPFLFGRNQFRGQHRRLGDFHWNMTLRHHLTPFGYDVSANLFLLSAASQRLVTVHSYRNQKDAWLGLEWQQFRDAPRWLAATWRLDWRMALWQQPQSLAFTADDGKWGGALTLRGYKAIGNWAPYAQLEAKTEGWLAGNVYLEPNYSVQLGFVLRPGQ